MALRLEASTEKRQHLGNIEASAMSGIKVEHRGGDVSPRASLKDIEL
jgi:hypothetical protein